MSHKCPVPGCKAIVGNARLMCPTHWRMVPGKLQNKVYHWNRTAPRSQPHFAAMQAAVDAVIAGAPKSCDHKFVDSNRCLKCGWSPSSKSQP